MKKLFLFFVLICFLFVGCKTTKNAGETLPPESQTETSDQVEIEQVPPVEESSETEPSLEDVIEEQGDLILPFDQEIDLETDEFTAEDEFYYGDDFIPENQEENPIPENTEVEVENEPELIISDEFFIDDEFVAEEEFLSEEEFLENQLDELTNEVNNEVEETEMEISENQEDVLLTEDETELETESEFQNENQLSSPFTEENPSLENNEEKKSELSQNVTDNEKNEVASETNNTNLTQNSPKEFEKKLEPNVEPITRKEIVEIVEDILSKKEPYVPTLTESEIVETEVIETILPSRTVYVAKNQTLLVPYPGSGWVYLGELESQALVGFRGKTFANEFTNFKFLPQKEGRTVLHFYKLDAISGNYIDDYLEVIVNPSVETTSIASVVTSPEFTYDMYLLQDNTSETSSKTQNDTVISSDSSINSETENFADNTLNHSQNSVSDKTQNTIQNDKNKSTLNQSVNKEKEESEKLNKDLAETEVVEEEPELLFLSDIFDDDEFETEIEDSQLSDDIYFDTDLLEKAKTAYENKDYENALSLVNQFLELSNFSVDEALFLKGQILEKPFANRNIREALNCYKKIISSYPQSEFWDKADERIKYIQRFYFNIR